jgi:hypothetical protein
VMPIEEELSDVMSGKAPPTRHFTKSSKLSVAPPFLMLLKTSKERIYANAAIGAQYSNRSL